MNERARNITGNKHAVYYDGSCPMCNAIIKKVDDSSHGESFSMRDITTHQLPPNIAKADVEKEIHVVGSDGKLYKNAEAILKILEAYCAWRSLVWFGRLKGVKQLLPFGYNFVAANRHFLFGPASRVYWMKVLVGCGLILGLLLSLRLWVSSRSFPLAPVVDFFPPIPFPLDWTALIALFGLLVATILSPRPRPLIWACVALVCVLAFLDQNRLQAWAYQYAVMWRLLGCSRGDLMMCKEGMLR
jgi:predicted DCC family thiol-disulfide oxidoreductase YuxK